jgi:hypothetical protein
MYNKIRMIFTHSLYKMSSVFFPTTSTVVFFAANLCRVLVGLFCYLCVLP